MGELKKQFAGAEKISDQANMAGDAIAMGDVLLEAGKPGVARPLYEWPSLFRSSRICQLR